MIAESSRDRNRRGGSLWQRLILVLLLPALLWVAARLVAPLVEPQEVDAAAAARTLSRWFTEELALAQRSLEQPFDFDRLRPSESQGRPLSQRLEGVGSLDSDDEFVTWWRTPPSPPVAEWSPREARWEVRRQGIRTRLVARSAVGENGESKIAAWVIDSASATDRFAQLVPRSIRSGLHLEPHFYRDDHDATHAVPTTDDAALATLRDPDGRVLGATILTPVPAELRRTMLLDRSLAISGLLFVVLLATLLPWSRWSATGAGCAAALVALMVARLALLWSRAPSTLLSTEWGTATSFGSSEAWGLIASPADLLLTTCAAWFAALALRRRAAASQGAAQQALLGVPAIALSVAAGWLVHAVVHHASEPWITHLTPWPLDGRSLVVLGCLIALLTVAELWGAAAQALGWVEHTARWHVALLYCLLVIAATSAQQQWWQALNYERLQSEFAGQVLDQSTRRQAALEATLAEVRNAFERPDPLGGALATQAMAHHFWSRSALFHGGYRSSLDFYTAAGDLLSRFAYDLPSFLERPRLSDSDGSVFETVETYQPAFALEETLLHAETIVGPVDEPIGIVVGHVLDEPDNVPLLSWSQPYLGWLGPGSPGLHEGRLRDGPHYVLYEASGTVLVTTLPDPPPLSAAMKQHRETDPALRIQTGAAAYLGWALQEQGRRHLLLLPTWTWLERLAVIARTLVAAFIVFALFGLLPRVASLNLSALIGGSLQRKLIAALFVASALPLLGLALFLQNYIERRGDADVVRSATRTAQAAQRVLEDYAAVPNDTAEIARAPFNDEILYWLRRIVGHEIHVYERGRLIASTKRELFESGLFPPRLDGDVQRQLIVDRRPHVVRSIRLAHDAIPVAYIPLLRRSFPERELVAAIPTATQPREIARSVRRVGESILLATLVLVALLSLVATQMARTVARPVRELVEATAKIASGDYATRLQPRSRDEVASLVQGFNSMAASLAAQREDLERRRQYMERLLRHATTGVISTDPDGRIVTMNPKARQLLRGTSDLELGASLLERLRRNSNLEPLAALLSDGDRSGEPQEVDLLTDGELARIRIVRLRLPDPAGAPGALILLDDVTDLMRSNQLAAWAEMARVIAHEIKNPLTPIQLSTEHLQRLLIDRGQLPADELEACIETVFKQVRTLHEIAGEFSSYASLPSLAPVASDPVAFMRETLAAYRAAMPEGIELEERYLPCPQVAIDSRALSRTLVNLIENALQAMPAGGRLTLSAQPLADGDQVELCVSDTGTGLDPQARHRIFELYFSTKSSGSGIGLAIARRTVEAHRGTIDFESELGRGTTFRIRLPVDRS